MTETLGLANKFLIVDALVKIIKIKIKTDLIKSKT